MSKSVDLEALEKEVTVKNELAKAIISNLKKEAKRFLLLIAKYNSQRSSDGILFKSPKQISFLDIEQYSDLISKQFCGKVEELNDKITKTKIEINKLSNEVKARPETDAAQKIQKFKEKMEQFDLELQQIWKQQHFLALNYRMDISTKEIQRWTAILNFNKVNQDKIKEDIDNLFK